MVGTSTVSFAVLPHAGDWHEADLMAAAERYRHPLHATPGSGPRATPPVSHPGLSVEGAVMTSLRRRDGELEVRLVAAPPNRPRRSYAARSPTPTESASWAPTTPLRPRPMANPARSGSRCGPGRSRRCAWPGAPQARAPNRRVVARPHAHGRDAQGGTRPPHGDGVPRPSMNSVLTPPARHAFHGRHRPPAPGGRWRSRRAGGRCRPPAGRRRSPRTGSARRTARAWDCR